jgi:glutaredoxin
MAALVLAAIVLLSSFSMAFGCSDKIDPNARSIKDDFTHTVLCEFGTSTGCGYCVRTHEALQGIYESGDYPFYYVALIDDTNIEAHKRLEYDYNLYGFPTCFFDGGYEVILGGYEGQTIYRASIEACGLRVVPDISINVTMDWLGDAVICVNVSIQNNETDTYTGHLRAFIVEPLSRWNNVQGHPYNFALIDWAFNTDISIPNGDVFEDTTTWDGKDNGFGDITRNNIMIIAAVYNSEWHQGYSDPPENLHAFDAYYVDETSAAHPITTTEPPETPEITGPTEGTAGEEYEYTFVTTDPDDDDVYYYVDWGDETFEEWVGPYNSGEEVIIPHTWEEKDTYIIRAKAKDIFDAGSDWGTLEVSMPLSRLSINILFLRFLERFPKTFPILRNMLVL